MHSNGLDSLARAIREVDDVRDVNRTPLFDNAPFLRLREEDRFVRAKRWVVGHKGEPSKFTDDYHYFIHSNNQFFWIKTHEQNGQLLLRSAKDSLMFDWDVSIEHGAILLDIANIANEMHREEYETISKSIQREFPEITYLSHYHLGIDESKVVPLPGNSHVVFEGIAFDDFSNYICKYRLLIGPHIFLHIRRPIAVGPKRVERKEFITVTGSDVDSPRAKTKRQEYEDFVRFRKLVKNVLSKPPASSDE